MMRGKQISYGNRLNVICSPRGTFIDLIKGPPTINDSRGGGPGLKLESKRGSDLAFNGYLEAMSPELNQYIWPELPFRIVGNSQ